MKVADIVRIGSVNSERLAPREVAAQNADAE
jgi:hypothetical protein